ncbi:hypothetical protein [Microbulbifer mangrovi]|uniref:hypothetical protein n=1 Tax=Microbulbifer mangrovi TaxID=927787 RepID=UPI001EFA64AF|nr:hypothetical protein [Microbulbifer mangrovi]
MPKVVPVLVHKPVTPEAQGCSPGFDEQGPLAQLGGRPFVHETVGEFYHAIGKYLTPEDTADHDKQHSRQAQFLSHALSGQSEPIHSARANFLARGLNPALFEALLEYFEARLLEIGVSSAASNRLVRAAGDLYERCQAPLCIAC